MESYGIYYILLIIELKFAKQTMSTGPFFRHFQRP